MGWPIVLARQAERDLTSIVRYIARDDPAEAERFGLALVTRVETLSQQPHLGSIVQGWENVRALLHGRYYIVYCCDDQAQRIRVLRFWHSARDLRALKVSKR